MSAGTADNTSFTAKPSKAVPLWLGILAAVLVVLFLETQTPEHGGNNFFINTNAGADGAEVLIDGKKAGVVHLSDGNGVGGAAFWAHLTRGKHVIEVNKHGNQPFSKEIDMHGEEYMGVDLKSARD